jgi:methyltransferase family protein
MSSSDLLQIDKPDAPLLGVRRRTRLRAQLRELLLRSWILRQIHKGVYSHEGALKLGAMLDGAEYAAEHMRGAHASTDKDEILLRALEHAPHDGLFLEFGVWSGRTINLIAERVNATVHGFDSFQGLPEDWQPGYRRGSFHTNGRLPSVRPNVTLHVGWFHETLPSFIAEHCEPIAFLHVDCDLYSSTKTVFQYLADRLRPGSVIVFDEYFNYPGWRNHEYRAFQEVVEEHSLRYSYLGYNTVEWNVAVQIR